MTLHLTLASPLTSALDPSPLFQLWTLIFSLLYPKKNPFRKTKRHRHDTLRYLPLLVCVVANALFTIHCRSAVHSCPSKSRASTGWNCVNHVLFAFSFHLILHQYILFTAPRRTATKKQPRQSQPNRQTTLCRACQLPGYTRQLSTSAFFQRPKQKQQRHRQRLLVPFCSFCVTGTRFPIYLAQRSLIYRLSCLEPHFRHIHHLHSTAPFRVSTLLLARSKHRFSPTTFFLF